jgi:hypothetical protein
LNLAVIRQARGQVLDDLTPMLLKLARKIEWKSEQQFDEWYARRRNQIDTLIRTFHHALLIHGTDDAPGKKIGRGTLCLAGRTRDVNPSRASSGLAEPGAR